MIFLAILVASALLNGYFLPFAGRRVRPEHVAAPVVFIAFVLWQMARRVQPIRRDAFAGLAVAWVAVNALSSWAYAPNPSESLVHVARLAFLAMAFLTVANLPIGQTSRDWIGSVRVWLVLGGIDLAYGVVVWVLARYGGPWLPGVSSEAGLTAISVKGTQIERNLLGIFAATLLPMAVYWLAAGRRATVTIAPRAYLVALVVLSSVLAVVSMTRSAWIAVLAVCPIVYLLFDRRWLPRADRSLLVTAVATPAIFVIAFLVVGVLPEPTAVRADERTGSASDGVTARAAENSGKPPEMIAGDVSSRLSTFNRLESDFTLRTRLQDARWAIDDWRASPWIGHGAGSFAQIHGTRVGSEAWISNLVLHTLVDTGLVGLAIQASFIILVAMRAWRVPARAREPDLAIGLKGLVVGLFVMLLAYQVTDGSWMALFWIHLGLIVNGIYFADAGER